MNVIRFAVLLAWLLSHVYSVNPSSFSPTYLIEHGKRHNFSTVQLDRMQKSEPYIRLSNSLNAVRVSSLNSVRVSLNEQQRRRQELVESIRPSDPPKLSSHFRCCNFSSINPITTFKSRKMRLKVDGTLRKRKIAGGCCSKKKAPSNVPSLYHLKEDLISYMRVHNNDNPTVQKKPQESTVKNRPSQTKCLDSEGYSLLLLCHSNIPSCEDSFVPYKAQNSSLILGQGCMGEVHLVVPNESSPRNSEFNVNTNSPEFFAQKIFIVPDGMTYENILYSFSNEVLTLSKLQGSRFFPNISCFHIQRNEFSFVMSYVPGYNLKDMLRRGDSFSIFKDLIERRAFALDFLKAIAEMHSRGVYHGDISPNNIIRTPQNKIVIIDFNSAFDEERGVTIVTGTAGYQSPELIEVKSLMSSKNSSDPMAPEEDIDADKLRQAMRKIGTGTDWWSFGATLYTIEGFSVLLKYPYLDGKASLLFCPSASELSKAERPEFFPRDAWDFIMNYLLLIDPQKRPNESSYEELMKHPYFNPVTPKRQKIGFKSNDDDEGSETVVFLAPLSEGITTINYDLLRGLYRDEMNSTGTENTHHARLFLDGLDGNSEKNAGFDEAPDRIHDETLVNGHPVLFTNVRDHENDKFLALKKALDDEERYVPINTQSLPSQCKISAILNDEILDRFEATPPFAIRNRSSIEAIFKGAELLLNYSSSRDKIFHLREYGLVSFLDDTVHAESESSNSSAKGVTQFSIHKMKGCEKNNTLYGNFSGVLWKLPELFRRDLMIANNSTEINSTLPEVNQEQLEQKLDDGKGDSIHLNDTSTLPNNCDNSNNNNNSTKLNDETSKSNPTPASIWSVCKQFLIIFGVCFIILVVVIFVANWRLLYHSSNWGRRELDSSTCNGVFRTQRGAFIIRNPNVSTATEMIADNASEGSQSGLLSYWNPFEPTASSHPNVQASAKMDSSSQSNP